MRDCARSVPEVLAACACAVVLAAGAWQPAAAETSGLPPALAQALRASGVPLDAFGVYARPVDGVDVTPLLALNEERPYVLASTTKVVTTLAALELLGTEHRAQARAYVTAPVRDGRLGGDLLLVGDDLQLTADEWRRWFARMRAQGLHTVAGRIVLDGLGVEGATAAARPMPAAAGHPAAGRYTVALQPGRGAQARVTVSPPHPGLRVHVDVPMTGGCDAWAHWSRGALPRLEVRGRWSAACGRREIADLALPLPRGARAAARDGAAAAASQVAALWSQAGGRLGDGVVTARAAAPGPTPWSVHLSAALPQRVHDINKASDNGGAKALMRALGGGTLAAAQQRLHAWLRRQGLADGDIHVDEGAGQLRSERGRPRAMVQLLRGAWHMRNARPFVDSLPVAGVDGTLARRLRGGDATGRAFLKTGTLLDTRALAGYVQARSGRVYALTAIVNHPRAAQAMPALDALVEWVADNG